MRYLRRLRAAFDTPTTLAVLGTITVSSGIAIWAANPGLGLIAFGALCLLGALTTAARPRQSR